MYAQACRQKVKIVFVAQIYVPYPFICPEKYAESPQKRDFNSNKAD